MSQYGILSLTLKRVRKMLNMNIIQAAVGHEKERVHNNSNL